MTTADSTATRIDGGYGWVVVTGAFIANAVGFGILYSFTVFFPSIVREFDSGRGATSVIPSVAAAVMLGMGGVLGRLTDRLGPRRMVAAGSVLVTAGLLLASWSATIWQVYLSYGLLLGLGVGSSFLPSNAAVGQWFARKRGLATGIAVAGSGVGSIIVAPVSERLIATYDWRVATRIIAVAGFLLLALVALIIRGRGVRHTSSVFGRMRADRTFRILYISAAIGSYGYWVPFVHIVPYARDRGLSPADAALLVAIMGALNIIGRVALGAVADSFGRVRIFQFALAAMTVAIALWPLAKRPGGLIAFVAAYGFFAGAFISLLFALTADYFGVERLPGITGLLNTAAALGTLLGPSVSGAIFDATGSYVPAILVAGLAMAVSTSFSFSLPPLQRRRSRAAPASG
jgi:MFS family permease